MKKTIYNKYDKHLIAELPRVVFPGRIVTVVSESEAEKAVDYLLSCDILGVDTETRPSFRKGASYKVSLLQVSSREVCFLFRLNQIGMPPSVIRLLEDTKVPKIGLSWHDDILSLHRRADFKPGLFIDLQDIVGQLGIDDKSLQKLYANIFHKKISKTQRLSNWDADILRDPQKMYAATDAWTCIKLYEEINRLVATHDYDLVVVPEPEPLEPNTQQQQQPKKDEKKSRRKNGSRKPGAKKSTGSRTGSRTANRQGSRKTDAKRKAAAAKPAPKEKKIVKLAKQLQRKLQKILHSRS